MKENSHSAPAPALLKVEQVAVMLNVKSSTIYEWVRMDYIPHIRLGVGKTKPCVRFDANEITSWLDERRRAGRPTRVPANMLG